MEFVIELEQETDGRWIAEVIALPGVMAYGKTPEEARAKVQALALRVLADPLEYGEADSRSVSISFAEAPGRLAPDPFARRLAGLRVRIS